MGCFFEATQTGMAVLLLALEQAKSFVVLCVYDPTWRTTR
jgi:hypothetical protein